MQILGNEKEYLTPSKLEIGHVYLFTETGDNNYMSASVYLGITAKNEYCFYVLMYLNVFIKDHVIYDLNEKELELLPKIADCNMNQLVSNSNIIRYSAIKGRVLKDLGIKYDLSKWFIKQRLINNDILPKLTNETKKRIPYVTKTKLKENTFYFNSHYIYYYLGLKNNEFCFLRLNYYELSRLMVNIKDNKVLKDMYLSTGRNIYEKKLFSIYTLDSIENMSKTNYKSLLLKKLREL